MNGHPLSGPVLRILSHELDVTGMRYCLGVTCWLTFVISVYNNHKWQTMSKSIDVISAKQIPVTKHGNDVKRAVNCAQTIVLPRYGRLRIPDATRLDPPCPSVQMDGYTAWMNIKSTVVYVKDSSKRLIYSAVFTTVRCGHKDKLSMGASGVQYRLDWTGAAPRRGEIARLSVKPNA